MRGVEKQKTTAKTVKFRQMRAIPMHGEAKVQGLWLLDRALSLSFTRAKLKNQDVEKMKASLTWWQNGDSVH